MELSPFFNKNNGFCVNSGDNYYKDLTIKPITQHKKTGRPKINELLWTKQPKALSDKQMERNMFRSTHGV